MKTTSNSLKYNITYNGPGGEEFCKINTHALARKQSGTNSFTVQCKL